MMFTDEGKLILFVILFLMGMYASGYFMGWGRNKLSVKIFDKMLDYLHKVRYWESRYEDMKVDYLDLLAKYNELRKIKERVQELVDDYSLVDERLIELVPREEESE